VTWDLLLFVDGSLKKRFSLLRPILSMDLCLTVDPFFTPFLACARPFFSHLDIPGLPCLTRFAYLHRLNGFLICPGFFRVRRELLLLRSSFWLASLTVFFL